MHWLAVAWNEFGGELPKVKEVNADRMKLITAALKDCPEQAEWLAAIKRVAASEHCLGKSPPKVPGQKPWVARFDWFLRPGSRTKALEGLYDGKPKPPAPAPYVPRPEIKLSPEEAAAAKRAREETMAKFVRGPNRINYRRPATEGGPGTYPTRWVPPEGLNGRNPTHWEIDGVTHTSEEVKKILENQFGTNAEQNEEKKEE